MTDDPHTRRVPRMPVSDRTLGGDNDLSYAPPGARPVLTGNARRDPLQATVGTVDEAIEQRMADARADPRGDWKPEGANVARPDLDDAARRLAIAGRREIEISRSMTKPPERAASVSLPDALAEKIANTLDMATSDIIKRIRAIKARCERIEVALIDDSGETKRRIHASIDFATKAEDLAKHIDAELDEIIEQHKQAVRAR